MRQTLLHNWNFIRWIRLILGVAIMVQAAMVKDAWFAFIGLIFTALALFNVGCCGGACYVPAKKENREQDEILYEEIK
ncbi:MAG: hypothetical protein JST86_01655 [Bacteroidetes bacterium]|nr:hypothetical protein [Bacteroidota bacterium]